MDVPSVKSVKIFAVVESVIETPQSMDDMNQYLRSERFSGDTTVVFNQGGVRTVTTREHIPLTMAQLDSILKKA